MHSRFYYWFFPKKCPACGKLTTPESLFCETCEKNLPRIQGDVCEYCGAAKPDCACAKRKNKYSAVVAPFYYDAAAKKAVLRAKAYPVYAEQMATEILRRVEEHYGSEAFDFVAFVPMHRRKERGTGMNHSHILAEELAKQMCLPAIDCLEVLYATPSQHSLDILQRSANVRGIYDVKDEWRTYIKGKNVLLVDDIKTTGATLGECALMLRLYGAKSVRAAVFALRKDKSRKEE